MSAKEKFDQLAYALPDCKPGKMFGKECIKAANGKALAIFFEDHMVFKLKDEAYDDAMALDGASIFAPAKDRPMKGWVQLPFDYVDQWDHFAEAASEYVGRFRRIRKLNNFSERTLHSIINLSV